MARQLNCVIIEDDVMAKKSLVKLCDKTEMLQMVGAYDHAEAALKDIQGRDVELIFLDIEMPGMSGFEFLDNLAILPQIIFTTGNREYAFEAYEYDVTDFLKKPITLPRFLKSVEKATLRQSQLDAISTASAKNEIYVRSEGRLIRIPFKSIFYFENAGDYIKVVTELGNFIIHGSMKSVDARIQNPRFFKVHRSYIVNLDKIKDIEDNTLVIAKAVIPISRAHKPLLLKSINIL